MASILVVDDDPILLNTLHSILGRAGHEVKTADNGELGLAIARRWLPDLVVLDIVMPGISGLELCRILRRESTVPILMLTAMDDEEDKVSGLQSGADDYLTKPFGARELLARVQALLRRTAIQRQPMAIPPSLDAKPSTYCLKEGELELDLISGRATLAGKLLNLKPKEFDLLAFLMHHRGQLFSQEQLLREVWGYEDCSDTRTVVVHIRRLREKLEADPSSPELLQTVRGLGYRFTE